ncbi:MAG: PIN domain-containing protein [Patescibacteria group bacterium]
MPRVFLDSNIWFSAFYGSQNCQKILEAGKNNKINLVISQQVLKETVRNIKEKIPAQLDNFKTFILDNPPEIFSDPETLSKKLEGLISVEDLPIFQAAQAAKVDYFVTGNTKDFKVTELKKLTKTKIVTPKQFLGAFPYLNIPKPSNPMMIR